MAGVTVSLRRTKSYPAPVHDYVNVQVKADDDFC